MRRFSTRRREGDILSYLVQEQLKSHGLKGISHDQIEELGRAEVGSRQTASR